MGRINIDKSNFNKSVYFILPMINLSSNYSNLINCYLGDNNSDPEINFKRIFVNVNNKDNNLISIKYYQSFYKLNNGSFMYIFHIPSIYNNDYDLFCEGKYSKFSDEYKDKIVDNLSIRPVQNSSIYKIIYKTSDQKQKIEEIIGQKLYDDEEVCSKPSLDKELYYSGE